MGECTTKLALVLLLGLLTTACVPPRATWVRPDDARSSVSSKKPPISLRGSGGHDQGGRVHVVKEGETLYRIAKIYGIDPDELADRNEITDPRSLGTGRELLLPPSKGTRVASLGPLPRRHRTASVRSPPRSLDRGPPPKVALQWPLEGVIYSRFGARDEGRHDGLDLAAPEGTPITAAAAGEVIFVGVQRGYGNIVILRHEKNLITLYAHNAKNLVTTGQKVAVGQKIALVGRTGRASGPHCHFEVREGTTPRDPLRYLRKGKTS